MTTLRIAVAKAEPVRLTTYPKSARTSVVNEGS